MLLPISVFPTIIFEFGYCCFNVKISFKFIGLYHVTFLPFKIKHSSSNSDES